MFISQAKSDEDHPALLASVLQNAFGSKQGDPRWNPTADLNKDGIVNMRDFFLYCHTSTPIIVDVSNNLIGDMMIPYVGIPTFNATVENANQCVMSYMYQYVSNYPVRNSSEWINQTMIRQGDHYIGTIDTNSIPGGYTTAIGYKIYAINDHYTVDTSASWFTNWNDP